MTDNRDIAMRFMQALWAADFDTTDRMLSKNARWFFQFGMPQAQEGRGRVWPASEALRRIVDDLFGKFDPEGFTVTVTRIIGEQDEIAVEYEASGRTISGRSYHNLYATILVIDAGLISEVRPYNDTAHMHAALND